MRFFAIGIEYALDTATGGARGGTARDHEMLRSANREFNGDCEMPS